MTDKDLAISAVLDFLNDKSKRILLLRGYDNDAKVRVVLGCLERKFKKGIIRTSSMAYASDHINSAFNKKLLPEVIKSTTNYDLGRMLVNISSYATHTANNPKGNETTYTLFHPVQLVLDDPKRYSNFLNELNRTNSSKIILITTNEWSIKKWDVENYVDEVFFYSVENDNPQIMTNLRNNGAI